MSPSPQTTIVSGLVAVGAQRIWAYAHSAYVRRRVLPPTAARATTAYLACLSGGGKPLFLTSPTAAESTLFYFEGLRSRWVVGMYGACRISTKRLARRLSEGGNEVRTLTLSKTSYMVLMDRERGRVHRFVEQQLGEAAPPGSVR